MTATHTKRDDEYTAMHEALFALPPSPLVTTARAAIAAAVKANLSSTVRVVHEMADLHAAAITAFAAVNAGGVTPIATAPQEANAPVAQPDAKAPPVYRVRVVEGMSDGAMVHTALIYRDGVLFKECPVELPGAPRPRAPDASTPLHLDANGVSETSGA